MFAEIFRFRFIPFMTFLGILFGISGLGAAWIGICGRRGGGADLTAFLVEETFPFEMTITVQKSGTALLMLELRSVLLNDLSIIVLVLIWHDL